MPSNGIRSSGHKLNHKKFHISTKNSFIAWRAAEHWLPGEMAESPPLETPPEHPDAFQGSLPWVPLPRGVQRCLPAGPPRVSREGARGHLLAPPPPSRAAQPGARVTGPGARAAAVTCPHRRERARGEPRETGHGGSPRLRAAPVNAGGKGLEQTVPAGLLRLLSWEQPLNSSRRPPPHGKGQRTLRAGGNRQRLRPRRFKTNPTAAGAEMRGEGSLAELAGGTQILRETWSPQK